MFASAISNFILLTVAGRVLCANPFFMAGESVHFELNKANDTDEITIFRLPNNTVPLSYALQMIPNLREEFGFFGEVFIDIRVKETSKYVYLHSKGLTIRSAQITRDGKKLFPKFTIDPANEMLKLESMVDLLQNATYRVEIVFNGTLNDNMVGFYRSSYRVGNVTKWLAITQFESTYARAAFPCYDEPAYRTPFSINIARYQHQKAISNMPLEWTSPPDPALDNRVWDTFKTTPAMSTYLVAFLVSEFHFITDSAKVVSVYTRENAIDDAAYALEAGKKLLKQMEIYTGIKYPLPKIDLAAIPDFLAGAMENWGLTTYRERYILYDPEKNSEESKKTITEVIAHELSHQWFGNYITPIWWNYLWLNEAFATYFESFAVAEIEPTWREDEYFVVDVLQNALFVDQAEYNYAMTWSVQSTTEISGLFNFIIYDKGASVLRMLEHVVSSSTFKRSLRTYLAKGGEKDGSVTPVILWDAFNELANIDKVKLPQNFTIGDFIKSWSENRGYPLINVRRIKDTNVTEIAIKQETFSTKRGDGTNPDNEWMVPLSYMKQSSNFSSTRPSVWSLSRKEINLTEGIDFDEWILFNINQTGYFRVNYDEENWMLLIRQLHVKLDVVPPINRAQLIDDAFSLAIDEKLSFITPLNLLHYLDKEKDPLPLTAALRNLVYITREYTGSFRDNKSDELQNYLIERIKPHFKRIGFDVKSEDDHSTKVLRTRLVKFACELNIKECVDKARKAYSKNIRNPTKHVLHPDTKEAVLCTVLRNDLREETWNRVWDLYHKSKFPYERGTVLSSAACSRNNTLLKKYINKLLNESDTDIRKQDVPHIYTAIFSTRHGVSVGLDTILDSTSGMSSLTAGNVKNLEMLATHIRSKIKTVDETKKVEKIMLTLKENKQGRFVKLVSLVEKVQELSNRTLPYRERVVGQLTQALAILPIPPTFEPQPSPPPSVTPISSATTSMPSILLCFGLTVTSLRELCKS